eukprot:748338-Hanusia_phi.AAC.7
MEEQADDEASDPTGSSDTIELLRSCAFASNALRLMKPLGQFIDLFHKCCRSCFHETTSEAKVIRKFFVDLFQLTSDEREEFSTPIIEAFCEELQDAFDEHVNMKTRPSSHLAVWLLDIISGGSNDSMLNKLLSTSLVREVHEVADSSHLKVYS